MAQRATRMDPHIHSSLRIAFLMVKMASSIARGHVRTMMTLHNMAAILQLIGNAALVYSVHFDIEQPFYSQLTPVKTRYLLTSIT